MSSDSLVITIFGGLVVVIILAFLAGVPGRFQDSDRSVKLLENQGFTNVEEVDKSVYFVGLRGCGEEDTVLFKFEATNPGGKTVEVETCQGWPFKGATLRE